jgi:hypothetical protein
MTPEADHREHEPTPIAPIPAHAIDIRIEGPSSGAHRKANGTACRGRNLPGIAHDLVPRRRLGQLPSCRPRLTILSLDQVRPCRTGGRCSTCRGDSRVALDSRRCADDRGGRGVQDRTRERVVQGDESSQTGAGQHSGNIHCYSTRTHWDSEPEAIGVLHVRNREASRVRTWDRRRSSRGGGMRDSRLSVVRRTVKGRMITMHAQIPGGAALALHMPSNSCADYTRLASGN